jgi:signal transduction histidine kinase
MDLGIARRSRAPARSARVAGVVTTSRIGLIEHADADAERLLNCQDAPGRLLLGFIDPVSQRAFLDDFYRARASSKALTSTLFVRPRKALPVRCRVTVEGGKGSLSWSFRPLPTRIDGGQRVAAALEGREYAARRIARDLHDEAGQMLAALHLAIDDVSRDLPEPAKSRVQEMRHLVGTIESQLRQIAHEMRPPVLDDLGLVPALESLAAGIRARSGLEVRVHDLLRGRLPGATETHLYRIVQDALANVVRHGRARRATVTLGAAGASAVLTVADDGMGFDVASVFLSPTRGLGLRGIQERVEAVAGTTSVQSAPGKGTTIVVTVPRTP